MLRGILSRLGYCVAWILLFCDTMLCGISCGIVGVPPPALVSLRLGAWGKPAATGVKGLDMWTLCVRACVCVCVCVRVP